MKHNTHSFRFKSSYGGVFQGPLLHLILHVKLRCLDDAFEYLTTVHLIWSYLN